MKTTKEDTEDSIGSTVLLCPEDGVSPIGFLCAIILFVWVIPAILILGLFRVSRAEQIGFALRDLISEFARKSQT